VPRSSSDTVIRKKLKLQIQQLLHDIGVDDAVLLQIMRNGILGKKGSLQPDFSPNPFALGVRRVRSVIAAAAATKLWAEVRALDLIELLELAPSSMAYGSGHVDF